MNANSEIVVTYGDSVLRESDVALLRGPLWLNDTLISFYFEYLSDTVYKDYAGKVLFVGPEVTQCLKGAAASELSIFLDPLNAKEKEILFFALNDNRVYERSGGTHWSLLFYNRCENTIFHYDSMSGTNYRQAAQLSGKLTQYFSPTGKADFEEAECSQQNNGHDCGIFVLCHAEFLMNHYIARSSSQDFVNLSRETVARKRHEILDIISKLREK